MIAVFKSYVYRCAWLNRWTQPGYLSIYRCGSSKTTEMPPCNFQPSPYKGISFDKAQKVRKENLSPALFLYYKNPVMIYQGHMQWLFDVTGKRYLDMFAGIVTVSVGHCHPKVKQAAFEQMELLWHTTNVYMHPTIHEYAVKLTAKMPENLKVVYFVNSGTEANDLALLMARLYTKSYDVISLRSSYHGTSPSAMGLLGQSTWRFNVPISLGMHQTMNADPYRGLWGGSHCRDSPCQTQRICDCQNNQCKAADLYVEQLNEVLLYSVPKNNVAALFVESIQGVGGAIQFPKGYIKKAFELIRQRGGVCVCDEVQSGFGRTGEHFWGFQMHNVTPDIVTMAKGIANGFPMAAVVTTPEIAQTLSQALHLNTYGGNPMACAVASKVLDVIEDEKLMSNSHQVGTHLILELAKLRDEFEIVGDVRGKGLMVGMELVTDKLSKTPIPASEILEIWEDCKDMGVLIGKGGFYGNVFRIKPPMCVSKTDVDFCVAVLRKALDKYTSKRRALK